MNNEYLDIILFGALAAFLIYRLRSVLGRRTGTERPPIAPRVADRTGVDRSGPVSRPGFGSSGTNGASSDPASGMVIDTVATRLNDPVSTGVAAIRAADPEFRLDHFVDGAKHAFEMIVKAFAAGDTATLRLLLSDDVYDTFAGVIRRRLAQKETAETKITRFQEPTVLSAEVNGRTAVIALKFVSDQISVTRDVDGAVIDGDPEKSAEHTDIWSFSRNTRSSDPNWFLIATDTHD